VQKEDILALVGRFLMAMIFLASAFGKITNFDVTTRYMEAHGLTWVPLLCAAAIAVETLGAISLILGYQARWGAAGLAGFVVAASWIFHLAPDQRIHLLKNMAILGGLLQVVAWGPGELSLEGRSSRS
jgi:putative oxidoreductase